MGDTDQHHFLSNSEKLVFLRPKKRQEASILLSKQKIFLYIIFAFKSLFYMEIERFCLGYLY